nr:hypothetical protein [Tanacetum cinerariifolium]
MRYCIMHWSCQWIVTIKTNFMKNFPKSRKRHQDDQDPPPLNDKDHDPHPPPPKDFEQNKKEKLDSDASASTQHPGPTKDVPIPDEVHNSDTEDTENAHLPKITTTTDWFRPIPKEEERPTTPEPEWSIPLNDFLEADNS